MAVASSMILLVPTQAGGTKRHEQKVTKEDVIHQLRKERREFHKRLENLRVRTVLSAPTAALARIAACESRGNPRAVSPGGTYRGKYQFDYTTWRAVGGTGDPAAAPEPEQDYRAWRLYMMRGPAPWPVCGYI